jgi:hypothetical protein
MTGATCLFLASKVEEELRLLDDIAVEFIRLRPNDSGRMDVPARASSTYSSNHGAASAAAAATSAAGAAGAPETEDGNTSTGDSGDIHDTPFVFTGLSNEEKDNIRSDSLSKGRNEEEINADVQSAVDAARNRARQKHENQKISTRILLVERLVMQTLCFDMSIVHPYAASLELVKELKSQGIIHREHLAEIRQAAVNFSNDSLRSTICLFYLPKHVAAAAVYLAVCHLGIPPVTVVGVDRGQSRGNAGVSSGSSNSLNGNSGGLSTQSRVAHALYGSTSAGPVSNTNTNSGSPPGWAEIIIKESSISKGILINICEKMLDLYNTGGMNSSGGSASGSATTFKTGTAAALVTVTAALGGVGPGGAVGVGTSRSSSGGNSSSSSTYDGRTTGHDEPDMGDMDSYDRTYGYHTDPSIPFVRSVKVSSHVVATGTATTSSSSSSTSSGSGTANRVDDSPFAIPPPPPPGSTPSGSVEASPMPPPPPTPGATPDANNTPLLLGGARQLSSTSGTGSGRYSDSNYKQVHIRNSHRLPLGYAAGCSISVTPTVKNNETPVPPAPSPLLQGHAQGSLSDEGPPGKRSRVGT